MRERAAFLVAGTHSGCGKTTLTLGLMAALRARGLEVQPFKVGPDFIDPGLHAQVAGRESRNLDGWMLGKAYNRGLFERLLREADVGVVEGVMGLFDGYDGQSESGSSAEMAKWLRLPVILVVDARSMARSAAALVHGFSRFDAGLDMAGVIFNRVGGEGHLAILKEAMAASLPEVPVLGGIPRDGAVAIPERHLGLVTADEMRLDGTWRERLVRLVEPCVDLDGLLQNTVRRVDKGDEGFVRPQGYPAASVPIAVARDPAFCFYYPENFELLRCAGAQLRFFSPLAGESVPREACGLYLGGGYPELFAERISANHPFLDAVRGAASAGMPLYAECGGLMVLGRFIETLQGVRYPMAGVFPFGTRMLNRRKALGYTEVVLRRPCLLGEPEATLRGHEFHYSEIIEQEASALELAYTLRKRKHQAMRLEGFSKGSVLASYIHLHWGSAPGAAEHFVQHCRDYFRRGAER